KNKCMSGISAPGRCSRNGAFFSAPSALYHACCRAPRFALRAWQWSRTNGGMAMTFDEVLAQVLDLLQRERRLSYRAIKVRFGLDDDHLEALKDEIIEAKQLAVDERGRVLVWTGDSASSPPPAAPPTSTRVPVAAIPTHLAEKILTTRHALEGER